MDPEKPVNRITVPGKGSRKGIPNKATSTVKDAFQKAFDLVGGPEALARWAVEKRTVQVRGKITTVQPNLEAFFTLATKLIPMESTTSGHISHGHYVAREVAVEQRDKLPAPVQPFALQNDVEDAVQVIDFIG